MDKKRKIINCSDIFILLPVPIWLIMEKITKKGGLNSNWRKITNEKPSNLIRQKMVYSTLRGAKNEKNIEKRDTSKKGQFKTSNLAPTALMKLDLLAG